MSILSTVGAAAVSGIWKVGAIVALVLAAGIGGGWALAAHDRDANLALFAAERQASDALRASLREQNRAVDELAAQKTLADERRAAAEQLAAANGRRLDRALEQGAGVKAATCAEAMPTVNKILEAVR